MMIEYRYGEYSGEYNRAEMCVWCHDRMADGLDDLRSILFEKLPSFFADNLVVSRHSDL